MVSFLLNLHQAFVPIVLAAGALSLVCGIALLIARRGMATTDAATRAVTGPAALLRRLFRILLSLTAAIGLLEAIFGALLYTQGCRPGENLHYVYGGIVLLAIPVAYAYSDQKEVRRDIIIMTIAAVVIIGAAVRALVTGPGGVCV